MPVLSVFGGIIPRMPWHRLPLTQATVAHDVKIRNGKLEPWREKLALTQAVDGAVCVWYHGCLPLTYDKCVDVAEFVTDYGRLFLTGRKPYPESLDVNSQYVRLGVPQPPRPLGVSGGGTGRDASSRTYVYTYVNRYGEEGAPSPPSQSVTVTDGSPVTLSGIMSPSAEYAVTQVNIYRTSTAWRSGADQAQSPATEYLLVASVGLPLSSYSDRIPEKQLGPALTTEDNREPPANLRHIRYLRGTGVLTGVTVNQVHFCRPYQPSNWPAELDLTLPYNIVNTAVLGNTLFVSTDSYPFVIKGAPSCEQYQCRPVDAVTTALPDISCGHVNSAVGTPFGMVYSSKDGLVLVSPDAKFQIITSGWFSTDDWIKIRPDTARLAYWRGYIVCVTDVLSFLLEIDPATYNDNAKANLVTISDKPVAMTVTQSDELILLENDILYQWNAGKNFRPYLWQSRELGFGGESTPVTAKVRTTGINFTILSQSRRDYTRFIPNETPVRLKRLGRTLNWQCQFQGTGTVEYAALGMRYNTFERNAYNGTQL